MITLKAVQVVFKPYPVWGPLSSSNPEAKKLKLPTANPPPEYVDAALAFDVVNRGTDDIPVGWNYTLVNQNYTKIQLVRGKACRMYCSCGTKR